jgi:hypothetical protein
MADPTGEADKGALRLDFDRRLLLRKSGEYRRIRGRTYCPGAAIRAGIWGIPIQRLV